MNEKIHKLNEEIAKTAAKLRRAEDKEKMLEHQMKLLTRKERTHRLCTRGAMLESYFTHPESVTDDQVSRFLKCLFHRSGTKELMEQFFGENQLHGYTETIEELLE